MRGVRLLVGASLAWGVLAAWAAPTMAAPGDLDNSFGSGGKSVINLGANDTATDVISAPGGKILVAGTSQNTGNPSADGLVYAQLTGAGKLDPAFAGGAGFSIDPIGGGIFNNSITLQPDGKIVSAGGFAPGGTGLHAFVARAVSPGGTLDTSFHPPQGFGDAHFGASTTEAFGVALQSTGQIVYAGQLGGTFPTPSDLIVGRLNNPAGTYDTSFGGGGTGHRQIDLGDDEAAFDVDVQPDDKVLATGYKITSTTADFLVVRLNADGTPDGGFGSSGNAFVDFNGGIDSGTAAALQPDGKIVVVGTTSTGGADYKIGVARLLSDGSPDLSFGSNGRTTIDIGQQAFGTDVALQPNGKVLVGGTTDPFGTGSFAVARLQPNGSLDTTFGDGGKRIVDFGSNDQLRALTLQPDGGIVLAGYSGASGALDLAVARLQGDPPGAAAKNAKCGGRKATIIGTNGKNKLKGTRKRDVIVGLGGKDTIKGLKGNDLICGGKAKDKLLGGPGKDRLLGQAGNDKLFGGGGKDVLKGGPGRRDKLNGGPGKDVQKP